MRQIYTLDCEGDGLHPTKFHVLSYTKDEKKAPVKSLLSYDSMRKFLTQEDAVFIIHNGMRWDKPHLERVLGIQIKARIIDTLFVSWYIFPNRNLYGLESFGVDYGVPKPPIADWENLTLEEYTHRCEEDVKINVLLWRDIKKSLALLYTCAEEDVVDLPIIDYLMFKASCALEQERSKWRLDLPLVHSTLETLYVERTERVEGLRGVMPPVPKKALKKPPAKPYKKDGTLSVDGAKWQQLLRENGLPPEHKEPVEVVVSYEGPNPDSSLQVKNWLFSMGWEPATFKYEREEDGSTRTIPQVRNKDKELCASVKLLIERQPEVGLLDGLTVANHRISILEGFLENVDEEGFVQASVQGLTNTLRFKHKTVVNLPGIDKPYGKEVRGSLIARDGYELMGSDIVALENNTGDHYIYDYDPDYVFEKSQDGYDPHIEMCILSGLITEDEGEFFKWYKKK